MARKCYVVTAEVSALVLAENETEAREEADHALREELYNLFDEDYFVRVATRLPAGWAGNCLVYGAAREDGDVTADDALKLNSSAKD